MNRFQFEVCANSVESCIAAQQGGADRVELCAGIPEGGTTPSYGEILQARRMLDEGARQGLKKTRLHVIIRPRGGDFLYTELELQRMIDDIRICCELGADGVVFGCLRPDGTLDSEANARLLQAATLDERLRMKDESLNAEANTSSSIIHHLLFPSPFTVPLTVVPIQRRH